ncbi:PDZ domain-containing protein [Nocardioides sp. GCM10027113]|uniref:YlbL family protein n=1 Tax=unclassified Nocardioides TaxID=2615069 RepID=UPI00360C930B
MTQRTLAGALAVPLLLALWAVAVTQPLPYVTYQPGMTVDVLAAPDGRETIQISGAETYRDDGELRMTTVYVTQPGAEVNLFSLMAGWLSPDDAVYPYRAVYQPEETRESNEQEGALEMVSSQDAAVAVALTELGYDVEVAPQVFRVTEDAPADGRLEPRDTIVAVGGEEVDSMDAVGGAVRSAAAGEPLEITVVRDGTERTVTVTPRDRDGTPYIGIEMTPGYRFPFDVTVDIDPNIGGPSAGLMFSLGIYDTLTPGSLTGGRSVAGSGSIDPEGRVLPIGGIQQKIAAARDVGADLFLVPPDNCAEALGASPGDMQLVRADTMPDAVDALEAWVDDEDADLPRCEENRT